MIEIPKKDYYLTTAIPYVNAAPHLGHALEFVQTDVMARYQKLKGKKVGLVTGSDENSLKNVHAAEKLGITTAELCKTNAGIFRKMADEIGLSYTSFRRTSDKETHWPGVHKLWKLCQDDIYKRKYKGLYCVGCECFYDENELTDGVCPEHRTKPEIVEEENYFFKLSNYQDKLIELIETDKLKIFPETRKNEVLSFMKGGLKDFSISRSITRAKEWGVPVPDDPEQIMYVWFDALGTYLTGIGYGTDEKEFEKYWPADVHVIGKGILRFHAVYWPAILLSAGLKLPKSVFVHGYITVEGKKMSKSLGNIIDPFHLIEKYGADPLRYCLLSEVPTFDDGDFSEKSLIEKNNNELIANLGNLVNRTMVFIANNFDSKVPEAKKLSKEDKEFLEQQKEVISKIESELDNENIREGINLIVGNFAKNANRYFQDNKPWELVKTDKERAGTVLNVLANQVKDIAILAEPYLPNSGRSIFKQLNMKESEIQWKNLGKPLKAGQKIGKPEIVFRKMELKEAEKPKTEEKAKPSFADLDLEVGQITEVKNHPDAEKLYVEKVKMKDREIQVVSGLVPYFEADELLDKKVLIVKNLAPAKLRGVDSQGMLLVAENKEDNLEILSSSDWNIGDKVKAEGIESKPKKEVTFKEFSKIKFKVADGKVLAEGKQLSVNGKPITTAKVKEGKVS